MCWPTTKCRVDELVPNTSYFGTDFWQFTFTFQFFFFDFLIVLTKTRNPEQLLRLLVSQVAPRITEHVFPCRKPRWFFCATLNPHPCNFSVVAAEIRDSNILFFYPMSFSFALHFRWMSASWTATHIPRSSAATGLKWLQNEQTSWCYCNTDTLSSQLHTSTAKQH